jgi:hypothetical protein
MTSRPTATSGTASWSVAGKSIASTVRTTADEVKEVAKAFEALGADELIFNPATDDLTEIASLADLVL